MQVQLQLLGVPRLRIDGRSVAVTWQRRSLPLLTYLFTADGALPRDEVAAALWPDDDDEAAQANLRRNLNLLRGVLPPSAAGWIRAEHGVVAFDHAAAVTDVAEFVVAARHAADLERAVDVYSGDFAASTVDPWVMAERERLRALFHVVLTELVRIEFSARRFDTALAHARRILADEPLREDIVRRVIAIHYAMGDRPGALREYDRFAQAVHDELDVEPMHETIWLRELIMRGEPLPFAPDVPRSLRTRGSPPESALLPFTGREAMLARMRDIWDAACDGGGSVLFVRGEAGIGKTRLVAEFLERVVGTGARILRGATASPESRPYEALLAAFGQSAPFVAGLELEAVWLAEIAALVPEVAARTGPLPVLAPLEPERAAARLFEAFTRLCSAVARGRPTVIVLEDLHWARAASFDALRYLALGLRGRRLLVVATWRADEESGCAALERELCASAHAAALTVGRLETDEVLALLARAQPPVGGAAARTIAERSEGHPLFLTELLREGPVALDAVSGGIAELVAARLERCSPDSALVARIGAVCGSTFDTDVLAQASGWDEAALLDRLGELLRRQFIRSAAVHERGAYAFTHALVRNAVLTTVDAGEQRRIHHIVARVLEARPSGHFDDIEIARHWDAAGEVERAAEAYLRAAQSSISAHAREEAAGIATRGLALATDPTLRGSLVRLRIEANLRRAPIDVLRADVALLREVATALDDDARFDAAQLACRVEDHSNDLDARIRAADDLRTFADDRLPRRIAQIAAIDARIAGAGGKFSAELAHLELAERNFARCGAVRDELGESIIIARVLARNGRVADGQAKLSAIEPRIVALDDSMLSIDYWYTRAAVAALKHDAHAVLRATERVVTLSRAAANWRMEGHGLLVQALAHEWTSQFTKALETLDTAQEIYESLGFAHLVCGIRTNRGVALLRIGRVNDSIALLRQAYREAKSYGGNEVAYFAANNLGAALLEAGQVEAALHIQNEALTLARGSVDSDEYSAIVLGDLGDVEMCAGQIVQGRAHLRRALVAERGAGRLPLLALDLARVAGAESSAEGATNAREALAIVEAHADIIARAPEILARCAHAFERAADRAAAAYCRRRGRELLDVRAAGLAPEDEAGYRGLRWHRTLVARDGALHAASVSDEIGWRQSAEPAREPGVPIRG